MRRGESGQQSGILDSVVTSLLTHPLRLQGKAKLQSGLSPEVYLPSSLGKANGF